MYRKEVAFTNLFLTVSFYFNLGGGGGNSNTYSSGVKSTISFHKGLPACLAYISQTALEIAAVAR